MGYSKYMMATLSTWKGHLQVSMMQSMTVSMLFVSGVWSRVAEESMVRAALENFPPQNQKNS